jgi:hypothetical protein
MKQTDFTSHRGEPCGGLRSLLCVTGGFRESHLNAKDREELAQAAEVSAAVRPCGRGRFFRLRLAFGLTAVGEVL